MAAATLRINLWSGPRNVSTALMYAFAQRPDTRVVDEPLYGHYLRLSGAGHPGAAEVLAAMDTDGERVVREVVLGPCDRPVLFLKQMAHHLAGLDRGFLAATVNVLLIRDPEEMLPSLAHQLPQPTLGDTGLAVQARLLGELEGLGQQPPVLDARELLLDPPGVLAELCRRLGLAFTAAMLSWPAGPRPEDGVWAPHWYDGVHRSTGFVAYRPKSEPFPPHLAPLLADCRPHYQALVARAIKARPASAGAGG
jgi:Sulfotransferase domain